MYCDSFNWCYMFMRLLITSVRHVGEHIHARWRLQNFRHPGMVSQPSHIQFVPFGRSASEEDYPLVKCGCRDSAEMSTSISVLSTPTLTSDARDIV